MQTLTGNDPEQSALGYSALSRRLNEVTSRGLIPSQPGDLDTNIFCTDIQEVGVYQSERAKTVGEDCCTCVQFLPATQILFSLLLLFLTVFRLVSQYKYVISG